MTADSFIEARTPTWLRNLLAAGLLLGHVALPAHALDAAADGDWISLGRPKQIHMGTNGTFYLNGSNQGNCAGVRPQYFRVDMSAPHWKEFYAWMLTMSATQGVMDCRVASGCGSAEVWVNYCRGTLP
jgi:hypothetical protein